MNESAAGGMAEAHGAQNQAKIKKKKKKNEAKKTPSREEKV